RPRTGGDQGRSADDGRRGGRSRDPRAAQRAAVGADDRLASRLQSSENVFAGGARHSGNAAAAGRLLLDRDGERRAHSSARAGDRREPRRGEQLRVHHAVVRSRACRVQRGGETPLKRRRGSAIAWALALSLAFTNAARAEDKWYELYQGALKSIASHKWTDAEKKLKGAVAIGPAPGRQVRMYGVRFIDYLPEYQLGLVYFNQQRYADALEQFAKVQTTGQVSKGDPEFATMSDMVELCRLRTADKTPGGQGESEALVRFARELMRRGSLEDARRALDTAAARTPGSADVASAREELVRLETEKRMRAEAAEVARREQAQPTSPNP